MPPDAVAILLQRLVLALALLEPLSNPERITSGIKDRHDNQNVCVDRVVDAKGKAVRQGTMKPVLDFIDRKSVV